MAATGDGRHKIVEDNQSEMRQQAVLFTFSVLSMTRCRGRRRSTDGECGESRGEGGGRGGEGEDEQQQHSPGKLHCQALLVLLSFAFPLASSRELPLLPPFNEKEGQLQ